jgi:Protein of unknown function (DUF4239)
MSVAFFRFSCVAFALLAICAKADRQLVPQMAGSWSVVASGVARTCPGSRTRWKKKPHTRIRGGEIASESMTGPFAFVAILQPTRLWSIPVLAAIISYWSFPYTSLLFHTIVQWASENTWIPDTETKLNLQATVVTQVVNGPVITSISVLFATLVSMTFSTLHGRQVDIQKSFVFEVQALRQLERLLDIPATVTVIPAEQLIEAKHLTSLHANKLQAESTSGAISAEELAEAPYVYIESTLQALLDWRNNCICAIKVCHRPTADAILLQVQVLSRDMLQLRGNRWLSMTAMRFPTVHYLTLYLLAVSIGIAFLVATDEAEFIFLRGLPVRILWTVLTTSFTALGVVLFDLSHAFAGAYQVCQ